MKPMIMTTIHGAVQVTIRVANVEINSVAWTRLNRGKTLLKVKARSVGGRRPGGQAADEGYRAKRNKVPGGGDRQQPSDIVRSGRVHEFRRLGGDDGSGSQAEDERNQCGQLGKECCAHDTPLGSVGGDIPCPVTQERPERDGIRHDDQRGSDESRDESGGADSVPAGTEGAFEIEIQVPGERNEARKEEQGGRGDRHLVHQQHELETIDTDD
jgi:hypothetical protein